MNFPDLQKAKNKIQIIIFGKGYGESILIHIGDDHYILIDSYINPETKNPIASDYLRSINLDENAIVGIICSHWDNDHISGMSDIISKISKTIEICVPLPQAKREMEQLSRYLKINCDPNGLYSTSEFLKLIQHKKNNKITTCLTTARQNLFQKELKEVGQDTSAIQALSPSNESIEKFIASLVFPEKDDPIQNLTSSNNDISIVTLLTRIVDGALFGADLENNNNNWDHIVSNYPADEKCSVFKIPHHGSSNGYNPRVWTDVVSQPISIITRYNPSNLPKQNEIDRIKASSYKVYVLGGAPKIEKVKSRKILKGLPSSNMESMKIIDGRNGIIILTWENGQWDINTYGEVAVI